VSGRKDQLWGQPKTEYSGPVFFISLYQMEATFEKKDLPVDGKA